MERILTDNIMNDKKICFIICYNDDKYISECLHYINRLTVPDGYLLDVLTVKNADSMTSGYNAAMNETDAKYKIYMHQDVFIVNINLLEDILKIFEDNGYYCVDNLPIDLIENFADLLFAQTSEKNKVAIGVDIRSGENLDRINEVLTHMKKKEQNYEILFLDCNNSTLIKRFKETRRSHPMGDADSVENEIEAERVKLAYLRKNADYIIDTSNLLVRDLRAEVEKIFVMNQDYRNLFVTIMSFGFKYGVPADCDLVFDVRFLPNPYYVPELKHKTGEQQEVRDYVLASPVSTEFLEKLIDMIKFLIPNYIDEGKNQLVIGIGCTGGHHRSVTVANELYRQLNNMDANYGIRISHRDILRN